MCYLFPSCCWRTVSVAACASYVMWFICKKPANYPIYILYSSLKQLKQHSLLKYFMHYIIFFLVFYVRKIKNVAYCCVHSGCWTRSPTCWNGERNTIGCSRQRQTKFFWMDSSATGEVLLNWSPEHSYTSDISSSIQHLGFSKWRCHHQGTVAHFWWMLIFGYFWQQKNFVDNSIQTYIDDGNVLYDVGWKLISLPAVGKWSMVISISVCMCLSASISQKPCIQTLSNVLCIRRLSLAHYFSGRVNICYL